MSSFWPTIEEEVEEPTENVNEETLEDNGEYGGDKLDLSMESNDNEPMVSLEELREEMELLIEMSQNGQTLDIERMEQLLRLQESHPDFILERELELEQWKDSVAEYCSECLRVMRGFIPPHIFSSNVESLCGDGLSLDLAKRIFQKQCLWLIRLSETDLLKLHDADLANRYNISGQMLDIVEIASIYAVLPCNFGLDFGKKKDFREYLESTLRSMYSDMSNGSLPPGKLRALPYRQYESQSGSMEGPIDDRDSVQSFEVVRGHSHGRRKSFLEVCKGNSIISSLRASRRSSDRR